jgi:outer membrane protein insertion porin family
MLVVRALSGLIPTVLCLVALAQPSPLPAQDRKYEGLEVTNIQFEPARQPLEAEDLHDLLPVKMRQPLRMEDVRASLDRLFATGRYADIQVDAKPYNSGVAITFITRNSWFIGDVSFGGKIGAPPNASQLETAARLELGAPYTASGIQTAIESQRRLLEGNGLYSSTITPKLDFQTDAAYQQVNIHFEVDSGRRARFGQPEFLGDLKLDPAKLLAATKFRRWIVGFWKPVTQTRLSQGLEGVRALYQKERRLEAKVTLESVRYDAATNSVIPTLHVDAGPRLSVNTIGAKISQKKLRRYVPVFEEHAVDHDLLVEGSRNLRDYFQSQGYFEAQVQFKEQRVANDKADIDYLIATGSRHQLVNIGISGNRYFDSAALRERMFLQPANFLQFRHGRYSESLLRRDESEIENLYRSNGFRDVKVTHRLVDGYLGKRGNLAVQLEVKEGPQYSIESLQVDGVERLPKDEVLSKLSSVAGQPFSELNVAVDRDAILAAYFEKGLPNATFEWSSKTGARPDRVALRYVVREGQEKVVRQVVATGYRTTRASLVNRNLTLSPGDPLSPSAITDAQRRLYDLGVFAKVDAAIQNPDGEGERKYVLYNMDEAGRYSFAAGFGAELGRIGGCKTCLDSPGGATGFSPRVSLDLSRGNLWGAAHSISLRTRVSTLDQRAIANYSFPRFQGRDNFNIAFTAMWENSRDVRTFNFRRVEGSAQLVQRLSRATTLFYRLTFRRVNVSDLKVTQFLINQLSQPVRVGMPSLNLVVDRRDDPVDPHRGIYNTVDLGLSERWFGSQYNFLRFLVRNSTYHPLGKRLVLARSTQFGNIAPFNHSANTFDAVPLPERFFSGGGTSHRGFPENQAGPRDTGTGFPLGGTALLFNQTELRFPVIGEDFGGVLFHDAGNTYSRLGKFSLRTGQHNLRDFDFMEHAVGFGIRYRTPVGPVRVDLGYSVNPPYYYGFKGTEQQLRDAGPNPCPPNAPNLCQVQHVSHFQFFFSIGQTF